MGRVGWARDFDAHRAGRGGAALLPPLPSGLSCFIAYGLPEKLGTVHLVYSVAVYSVAVTEPPPTPPNPPPSPNPHRKAGLSEAGVIAERRKEHIVNS